MPNTINSLDDLVEKNIPLSMLLHDGCGDCPESTCDTGGAGCDAGAGYSDTPAEDNPTRPWLARMIESSFYRAMELCFDELDDEPKRILLVGGCRQRDFARRLGFMLPFCKIVALDPDGGVVEKARQEVACRFRFEEASLAQLPYNTGGFDLTIVHNLAEYTDTPQAALTELARVTKVKGHLLVSHHRSLVWALMGWIPGVKTAMAQLGCQIPFSWQDNNDWETALFGLTETQLKVLPLPWDMRMTRVKPRSQSRTQLT